MDIERQVIGEILLNAGECGIAFEDLKPEYFEGVNFRKVFETMTAMNEAGEQIDIATLTEKGLNSDSLMVLASEVHSAAHIKSHVKILKDHYYMRSARQRLIAGLSASENPGATTESLRKVVEDTAFFLAGNMKSKGLQPMRVAVKSSLDQIGEIGRGQVPGVKMGFFDMDRNGFFFKKKTLSIVAARPAMGKSAFAWTVARNCKKKVAFFSLEMAKEEQAERSLSADTGITNDQMKDKDQIKKNAAKLVEAAGRISEETIWVNDDTSVSVAKIHSQCKRMLANDGLDLLIVDYLGLIESDKQFQKRNQEVGYISKGLKYIADDLGIPVVALCQLNRDCEARADKRPLLSDLRESGDMEQDAHMVIFIYRDEVYDAETEDKGVAELIVRKNRSGQTGIVKLTFDGPTTSFKDYVEPASFSDTARAFDAAAGV